MFNPTEEDLLGSSSDEGARKLLYKEYCTIIPAYHAKFLDDNVLVKENSKQEEERFVEHLLGDVMRNFPHLSEVTATMIIRKTYRDMPQIASSYFRRREEETNKANVATVCDTSGDSQPSESSPSDSSGTETTSLCEKDISTELEKELDGKEKGKLREEKMVKMSVELHKELEDFAEEPFSVPGKRTDSELDTECVLREDQCCDVFKSLGNTELEYTLQGACGNQMDSNDDSVSGEDGSRKREKALEGFKIHLTRTLLRAQSKPRSEVAGLTCLYASNEKNAEEKLDVGNSLNIDEASDDDEQRSSCDDCNISEMRESINHPGFPSTCKRMCKHGHRLLKDTRRCKREVTKAVMKRIMCPLQETEEELPVDLPQELLVEKNQCDGLIPDMTAVQRKNYLRDSHECEGVSSEPGRKNGELFNSDRNSTTEPSRDGVNLQDVNDCKGGVNVTVFVEEQQYFTGERQNSPDLYKGESYFITPNELSEDSSTALKPKGFDLATPQHFISAEMKSYEERTHEEVYEHARSLTPLPILMKRSGIATCSEKNNTTLEDNAVQRSDTEVCHDSSERSAVPASLGFLEKTEFSAETRLESSCSSEVLLLPHEDDAKSLKRSSSEYDIVEGRTADRPKPKKYLEETANRNSVQCIKSSDTDFQYSAQNDMSLSVKNNLCTDTEQKQDRKLSVAQSGLRKSEHYEPAEGLSVEYPQTNCEREEQNKQGEPEDIQGCPKGSVMIERQTETDVTKEQTTDGRSPSCAGERNDNTSCRFQSKGYALTRKAGRTDLRGFDAKNKSGNVIEALQQRTKTGSKTNLDITSTSQLPSTYDTEEKEGEDTLYLCFNSETQTAKTCHSGGFPSFVNLSDTTAKDCDGSVAMSDLPLESSDDGECSHKLPTNISTADQVKCGAHAALTNNELNCGDHALGKSVNDGTTSENLHFYPVPKLKELIEQHTQEEDKGGSRSKLEVLLLERKEGFVEEAKQPGNMSSKSKTRDVVIEQNDETSQAQRSTRPKENISRAEKLIAGDGNRKLLPSDSPTGGSKPKGTKKTSQGTDQLLGMERSEEINVSGDCESRKPRERLRLLRILEASWPKLSETEIKTIERKAKSPPSSNEEGCCGSHCKVETKTSRSDSTPNYCEDQEKLEEPCSQSCAILKFDEESFSISQNLSPCRNSTESKDSAGTSRPTKDSFITESEEFQTALLPTNEALYTELEDSAAAPLPTTDHTDRSNLKLSAALANDTSFNIQQLESYKNETISDEEHGSDCQYPEMSNTENVQGASSAEHSSVLSYLRNYQSDSEAIRKGPQDVIYDEKPGRFLLEVYLKQSRTWNKSRSHGIDSWDKNSQNEISANLAPLSPVSCSEEGFFSAENSIHSADTFPGEDCTLNSINISNFSGDQLELIQVSPDSSNSDASRNERYSKADRTMDCSLTSGRFNLDIDLKNTLELQLDRKKLGHLDVNDRDAGILRDFQQVRKASLHMSAADERTLFEKTNEGTTDDLLALTNQGDTATTSGETSTAVRDNDENRDEGSTSVINGSPEKLIHGALCQEEECGKILRSVIPSSEEKDQTEVSDILRLNEFVEDCNPISGNYVRNEFPDDPPSSKSFTNLGSSDYCLKAGNTFCTQNLRNSAGDSKDCLKSVLSHKCSSEIIPSATAGSVIQDVNTSLCNPQFDERYDQKCQFMGILDQETSGTSMDNSLNDVIESKFSNDVADCETKEDTFGGESGETPVSNDIDLAQPDDDKSDYINTAKRMDETVDKKGKVVTSHEEQQRDDVMLTIGSMESIAVKSSEINEGKISHLQNEENLIGNSVSPFQEDSSKTVCGAEDSTEDRGFSSANWADDEEISDEQLLVSSHDRNEPSVLDENSLLAQIPLSEEGVNNTVSSFANSSTSELGDKLTVDSSNEGKRALCEMFGKNIIAGDVESKEPEVEERSVKYMILIEERNRESEVTPFQHEEVLRDGMQSKHFQSGDSTRISTNSHQVLESGSLQKSADYMALLEAICMSSGTKTATKSDDPDEHPSKDTGDGKHFIKESAVTFSKVDRSLQKDASVSANGKSYKNKLPSHSKLQTEDACLQKEEPYSCESLDGAPEKTLRSYNQKSQNSRKFRDSDFYQGDGSAGVYSQRERKFSWKAYRNRRIAQKYEQDTSVSFDCRKGSAVIEDRSQKNAFSSNGMYESSWQKRNQGRKPQNSNRMGTGSYVTSVRCKTTEREKYNSDYREKSRDRTLRSDYRSRSREYRRNCSKEDKRSRSKGEEYYGSSRGYYRTKYNQKSSRSRSRQPLADKRQSQPPVGINSSRYGESRATAKNKSNRNGNGVECVPQTGTSKNKSERIKKSVEVGDNECESNNSGSKAKGAKKSRRRRTVSKKRSTAKSRENAPKKEETKVDEKQKGVENCSLSLPKASRCDSKGCVLNHSENGHENKRGDNSKTRSNKEGTSDGKETLRKSSKADEVNRKTLKNNDASKKSQTTEYSGKVQKDSNSNGKQTSAVLNSTNKVKQEEPFMRLSLQEQPGNTCFQDDIAPDAPSSKASGTEAASGDVSKDVANDNHHTAPSEEAPPELGSSAPRIGQSWKPNSINQYRKYYGQTWANMRDNWKTFGYVNYMKMNYPPVFTGWDWRGKMGYASSRYRSCLYYPPNGHEHQNFGNMYFWKAYEEMRYQNVFSGTAQYAFHGNDQARRVGRRYDSNSHLNRQTGSGSRTSKGWSNPRYSKYSSNRSSECQNWRERRSSRGQDAETFSLNSGENSRRVTTPLEDIHRNQQTSEELHENNSTAVGTSERIFHSTRDLDDARDVGENIGGDNLPGENLVNINDDEETLEELDHYYAVGVPQNAESEGSNRNVSDDYKAEFSDPEMSDRKDTHEESEIDFSEMPFWEVQVSETQNFASSVENRSGQPSCEVSAEPEDDKAVEETYNLVTPEENETERARALKSALEYDVSLHSFALEGNQTFEHGSLNETQWKKQYFWKNVEQPSFEYPEQGDQREKPYLYGPLSECGKNFSPCFSNEDYVNYMDSGQKENYTMTYVSPDSQELPVCDFYPHNSSGTRRSSECISLQSSNEQAYEKYSLIINIAESDSETEENSATLSNTNSFSEFDSADLRMVSEMCNYRQDAEVVQPDSPGTQRMHQEIVTGPHCFHDLPVSGSNESNAEHLFGVEDCVESQMEKNPSEGCCENENGVKRGETLITVRADDDVSKSLAGEGKGGNLQNNESLRENRSISRKKSDDSAESVEDGHPCSFPGNVDISGGAYFRVSEDQRLQYCMDVPLYCEGGTSRDDAIPGPVMRGTIEQAVDVLEEITSSPNNVMREQWGNGSTPRSTQLERYTGEGQGMLRLHENNQSIGNGNLVASGFFSGYPTKDDNKVSDVAGKLSVEAHMRDVYRWGNASDRQAQNNASESENNVNDDISESLSRTAFTDRCLKSCSSAESCEMIENAEETSSVGKNPETYEGFSRLKSAEAKEELKNGVNITEVKRFDETRSATENPTEHDYSIFAKDAKQSIDANCGSGGERDEKREKGEKSLSVEREEAYLFREYNDLTSRNTDGEGRIVGEKSGGPKTQSDDVTQSKTTLDANSAICCETYVSYSPQATSSSLNSTRDLRDHPVLSNYSSRSFDKPLGRKNSSTKTDYCHTEVKHADASTVSDLLGSDVAEASDNSLLLGSVDTDVCNPRMRGNSRTEEDNSLPDVTKQQVAKTGSSHGCQPVKHSEGSNDNEDTWNKGPNGSTVISKAGRNSSKSSSEDILAENCDNLESTKLTERNDLLLRGSDGKFAFLTEPQQAQNLNCNREGQVNPSNYETDCSTYDKLHSPETCGVIVKEIFCDKGKLLPEWRLNTDVGGSSTNPPSGLFGEILSDDETAEGLPVEKLIPQNKELPRNFH